MKDKSDKVSEYKEWQQDENNDREDDMESVCAHVHIHPLMCV